MVTRLDEVAELLALGYQNKQIEAALGMTRSHVSVTVDRLVKRYNGPARAQ